MNTGIIAKITILLILIASTSIGIAQTIKVDAINPKQNISTIGGDLERAQNFVQKAANSQQVMNWCFKDIDFNICRVSYNKKQVLENDEFYVEGSSITSEFAQWQFTDAGSGQFRVYNPSTEKFLQCTNITIDGGVDGAVQTYAVNTSKTGSWTKWKKVDAGNGWFYLHNEDHNKYLQCTSSSSQTAGLHVRCVNTTVQNASTQWKEVTTGSNVLIQNNAEGKNLTFNIKMFTSPNMAFYNDAVSTMQMVKQANPNIKFYSTMKSDYAGYDEGNHNNLPVNIYQFACVLEDTDGRTCLKSIGDKSFDVNAYGLFLADYLEHMHNNGVTIDYLAPTKEWTVVGIQRSHDVVVLLQTECANRGVPYPEFIAPGSWRIGQGISFINQVISNGFENDFYAYATHDYNDDGTTYEDFVYKSKQAANKPAWNDETGIGNGGRTNGAEINIQETINAYIKKVEMYNAGIDGEVFFELTSRGVNAETRSIYFTNGATGYRMRSHYILKEFTNKVIGKDFVSSSTLALSDVHILSFRSDDALTLVVLNNSNSAYTDVVFELDGIDIQGYVEQVYWTNNTSITGTTQNIDKSSANTFTQDLEAKSYNVFKIGISNQEDLSNSVFINNVEHDKKLSNSDVNKGNNQWYAEGVAAGSESTAEQWEFVETNEQGWYYLKNISNNSYLQCTSTSIDGGEDGAVQVYLVSSNITDHSVQWKKINAGGGRFHLLNRSMNKYLQCTNYTSQTSGYHIRGVNTNKTGTWTQWTEDRFVGTTTAVEKISISNKLKFRSNRLTSGESFEITSVSPDLKTFQISIYDTMGKLVFKSNESDNNWLVTSNTPNGLYVYLVKFTDYKGKSTFTTGKIMVY